MSIPAAPQSPSDETLSLNDTLALFAAQYEGTVALQWHRPAGLSPDRALPGWAVTIKDVQTGQSITTVTGIEIHAPQVPQAHRATR
jgi:hypothetical protein